MQAFIDFLVNNYLWFIIISFILIFALIGYLVDTNEKKNKDEKIDEAIAPDLKNLKIDEPQESANMDMGLNEANEVKKDVIIMSNTPNAPINDSMPIEKEEEKETEILDL